MEFFIPHSESDEQAGEVYAGIKKNLLEQGFETNDRRVYSLTYTHDGRTLTATVGEQDQLESEVVIALFYEPLRRLHHICTPNRAVIRGGPIFAGEPSVLNVEDFDL